MQLRSGQVPDSISLKSILIRSTRPHNALITQRSQIQILPPQPKRHQFTYHRFLDARFVEILYRHSGNSCLRQEIIRQLRACNSSFNFRSKSVTDVVVRDVVKRLDDCRSRLDLHPSCSALKRLHVFRILHEHTRSSTLSSLKASSDHPALLAVAS